MYQNFFKKTFDILISLLLLPVFLILSIIISIMIKLDDNGPIFYVDDRIGKNNKIFRMLKFRTMKVDAPLLLNPDGSTYNSEEDPRVTRVGKLLRRTSLDEIPQIINVIKGEMSIVGPRPSLAEAIGSYKEDEKDKMKVRPGITGYTQAYYRNTITNREKRLLDAWYANNFSFKLDLKILLRTFFTVITQKGIFTNNNGEH